MAHAGPGTPGTELLDSFPLTAGLTIVGTALKLGSNQRRSSEGLPSRERSVRVWPTPWARSVRFPGLFLLGA
jgi:hypothetical protein